MTKTTTDKNFNDDVTKNLMPTLVDFWAEWCGPCKQLSPVVDEIAKEMQNSVEVFKINIDENPEIPSKMGVRGIPTLMLFKNGKLISSKVGVMPKTVIKSWIEDNI